MQAKVSLQSSGPRYRLCVYRSNRHIYAQIIDDSKGYTICSASSLSIKDDRQVSRNIDKLSKKIQIASQIGKEIAEKASQCGITKVFFDRNDYKYHGRVKQLAESAREFGLNF